jgi:ATP-dependent DNA helicase RecG
MQTPPESGHSTPFQEWLDRIARPIEFASRDEYAHLGTVKNLSSFIATQVLSALAQQVYPKLIEARLVALRDLFIDFQQSLPLGAAYRLP